jgi:hypothetical protein
MPKKKRELTKTKIAKPGSRKRITSPVQEISWMAPEWAHHSKDLVWWVGFLLLFTVLVALFYVLDSWLGITYVVLISAVVVNYSFRKPKEVLCKIDSKGVKIGTRFFEWSDLMGFWMVENMPYTILYLRTTNKILSVISIETPKTKQDEVHKALAKHLPDEDSGEALSDRITRYTRF